MTLQEAAKAIEAESLGKLWSHMGSKVRRTFIETCINEIFVDVNGQPEAAKKVKQRKPRKAKTAPLTQHAEGSE